METGGVIAETENWEEDFSTDSERIEMNKEKLEEEMDMEPILSTSKKGDLRRKIPSI